MSADVVSISKRKDDRILKEIRRRPMPMAHLVATHGFDAIVRLVEQYQIVVEDEMVREASELDELYSDSRHLIKTQDEEGNLDIVDVTPIKFFEKLLDRRLQDRDFFSHEAEYVTFFRRLTQKQLMFLAVMLCNKCQRYGYLWAGEDWERNMFTRVPGMAKRPYLADKLLSVTAQLEKANLDICAAFRMINQVGDKVEHERDRYNRELMAEIALTKKVQDVLTAYMDGPCSEPNVADAHDFLMAIADIIGFDNEQKPQY